MRILILALFVSLAACAAGNDWPSLARRPGESAPLPEVAARTAPGAEANVSSSSTAVVSGRLVEASRDFAAVEKRWQGQKLTTTAAVFTAKGAADTSEVAVKAQLELSRFDRIGAQIGDLRTRLDAIGGDLALSAAAGNDSAGALRELGELIGRVETLRAEHKAASGVLLGK